VASAKVVALKARSSQISHLCFPVPGVIETLGQIEVVIEHRLKTKRPVQLGDLVTQFDFVGFYGGLSTLGSTDPSLLMYNSSGILNDPKVQASLLMTLRGESTAAVLDKAINARQNAYYAKYANQQSIIDVMTQIYDTTAAVTALSNIGSQSDGLAALLQLAASKFGDLNFVYNELGLLPSVSPSLPNVVAGTSSVLTTTGSLPDPTQTIKNTDFSFQTPLYDIQAQCYRSLIGLSKQLFSQYMAGQSLPHLNTVFNNEKQGIDLDVKRLRIAYLNTILMSPISGVITGIYKNVGDWVQAGEPVIRVENNTAVILVATLRYQGSISIGQTLTVTTSPFDSSSGQSQPTVAADIIAVRGHPNEDDLWEVHAAYTTGPSFPTLPPNYHFDYDDTSVTIT
jgi:hypothetical protein